MAVGAKLEWNPCEDAIYTTVDDDSAHQPRKGGKGKGKQRRRNASPNKSGRSVPLQLPSVLSANQSLLVQAQREKALSGSDRPKTPVMNQSMLLSMSDDAMQLRDAKKASINYDGWRKWTSGEGTAVSHRHEMRVTCTRNLRERERERERERVAPVMRAWAALASSHQLGETGAVWGAA